MPQKRALCVSAIAYMHTCPTLLDIRFSVTLDFQYLNRYADSTVLTRETAIRSFHSTRVAICILKFHAVPVPVALRYAVPHLERAHNTKLAMPVSITDPSVHAWEHCSTIQTISDSGIK